MLIAIISDIHDNIPNLEKCLNWCKEKHVEKLICCGDVTNLETVSNLANNFTGEIFIAEGNCRLYEESDLSLFKNITYCGEVGIKEEDGLKIGFCHEKRKIIKMLSISAEPLDFIFYGHSHKPWIEKKGVSTIANPGNLAGVWNPATFAVLDTTNKKLELKILSELK